MEKIVSMLRNGSNIVYIVPIQVNSYREVIDRWLSYKRFEGLTFTKQMSTIRDVFRFHRSNIDHIILYYSALHSILCYAMVICLPSPCTIAHHTN